MKVEASVVLRFQASSLAETGVVLDALARARERDDIDVGQINVMTPPGPTSVSLPVLSRPAEYPPGVPRSRSADGL